MAQYSKIRKEEIREKEKKQEMAVEKHSYVVSYKHDNYRYAANDFVGQRSSCYKRSST